jgi:phosphoribosylpyrophosphate synthetase
MSHQALLQERFYFGDSVLPLFESGVPLLLEQLHMLKGEQKVITVAYPDEGAWKRFHGAFRDFPEVVCTKVRDGDKRIVRLKEGNPKECHVVIVDDLVQSGGTLIECGKLLRALGAAHVSAYVTHGVFPQASYQRFEPEKENGSFGWRKVWITDSCPQTSAAVAGRAPFEVLSLAQPIADALRV